MGLPALVVLCDSQWKSRGPIAFDQVPDRRVGRVAHRALEPGERFLRALDSPSVTNRTRAPAGRSTAAALPGTVEVLTAALPRLDLNATDPTRDDDVFDALISALVARAAALALTDPPPDELRDQARREGWIHLPQVGSLEKLM